MPVAAAQAAKFYEQVVADGKVFTFMEDGGYLIYPIQGKEVVPFWSSRTRLEAIQTSHPKYRKYEISELALEEFLRKDLQLLEDEKLSVGINWSGPRLTGYDLSVTELRKNIALRHTRGASEA